MKLHNALRGLAKYELDANGLAIVAKLRDLWRSFPALEDRHGLDAMSRACDEILRR